MSLEHSPTRDNRQGGKSDPLELLRAEDLAELLKVHIETIRRWARQGKMPAPFKLSGGVTAWRRDVIEAWLSAKEREG